MSEAGPASAAPSTRDFKAQLDEERLRSDALMKDMQGLEEENRALRLSVHGGAAAGEPAPGSSAVQEALVPIYMALAKARASLSYEWNTVDNPGGGPRRASPLEGAGELPGDGDAVAATMELIRSLGEMVKQKALDLVRDYAKYKRTTEQALRAGEHEGGGGRPSGVDAGAAASFSSLQRSYEQVKREADELRRANMQAASERDQYMRQLSETRRELEGRARALERALAERDEDLRKRSAQVEASSQQVLKMQGAADDATKRAEQTRAAAERAERDLRAKNEQLHVKIEELMGQLRERENDRMATELGRAQGEEARERAKRLAEENEACRQRVQQLQEELQQAHELSRQKIADLAEELKSRTGTLRTQNDGLRVRVEELTEELAKRAEGARRGYEDATSELRLEADVLREKLRKCQEDLRAREAELDRLRDADKAIREERVLREAAEAARVLAERDLRALQAKTDTTRWNQELMVVEERFRMERVRVEREWRAETEKAKVERAAAVAEVQEVEERLRRAERALRQRDERLEGVEEELRLARERLSAVEGWRQEMEKVRAQYETRLQERAAEARRVKEAAAVAEGGHTREIMRLREALEGAQAERQRAERALADATARLSGMQGAVLNAEQVKWQGSVEATKLRAELEWRAKQLAELEAVSRHNADELERARARVQRLEARRMKTEEALEDAIAELRGKTAEVDAARRQVDALLETLARRGLPVPRAQPRAAPRAPRERLRERAPRLEPRRPRRRRRRALLERRRVGPSREHLVVATPRASQVSQISSVPAPAPLQPAAAAARPAIARTASSKHAQGVPRNSSIPRPLQPAPSAPKAR
eukprot:tig00001095_g7048.t1